MTLPTIGLDLKTLSLQNAGIGRYTASLSLELLKRNRYIYTGFFGPSTDQQLLKDVAFQVHKGIAGHFSSTVLRSTIFLPLDINSKNIDLFHSMDNSTVNLMPFSRCKRISTIHDVIVFKHPEFFTRKHLAVVKQLTTLAADKADHIIADSISTKKDLLKIFKHLREEDISVVHLAQSPIFRQCSKQEIEIIKMELQLPQRYFLSLATQEPRKNLVNLIKAFQKFKKNSANNDVGLVLVGGKGWLDSGSENNGGDQNIIRMGFLEDRLLPPIYSGALAFVYPSFYEGFGLPVLEAMSCGRPIITSHNSSLPEVADTAAIYIDPHSIDSIKTAMEKIADNSVLATELTQKSINQSRQFSWEKTAFLTETVYGEQLNK